MDPNTAIEYARNTLLTALTVAAPLLGAVLLLALFLAIAQTVLNLQEQTLTIVPKIVTAILMTCLLAPWMLRALMEFTLPLLRDVLPMRG